MDPARTLAAVAACPFHVLTWLDEDGYPASAAVRPAFDLGRGRITLPAPAGLPATSPAAILAGLPAAPAHPAADPAPRGPVLRGTLGPAAGGRRAFVPDVDASGGRRAA
jgi:hypothetical protein